MRYVREAALHDHFKLKNLKFLHSKIKPKIVNQNIFLNKNLQKLKMDFIRENKTESKTTENQLIQWANEKLER